MAVVNKVVGGAGFGVRDWLVQRVTAVYMALYSLVVGGWLVLGRPLSYERWYGLFAIPWVRHATLLFFLCACWHAWLGMRDIFMDYVRATALRLALEAAAALVLLAYAARAAEILWGVV